MATRPARPTRQVNWLRGKGRFDFTGLTASQISAKKDKAEAAALVKINKRLRALPQFKLESVKWKKERTKPIYLLVVYLTPPAIFHKNGAGAGGGSKITPSSPEVP